MSSDLVVIDNTAGGLRSRTFIISMSTLGLSKVEKRVTWIYWNVRSLGDMGHIISLKDFESILKPFSRAEEGNKAPVLSTCLRRRRICKCNKNQKPHGVFPGPRGIMEIETFDKRVADTGRMSGTPDSALLPNQVLFLFFFFSSQILL